MTKLEREVDELVLDFFARLDDLAAGLAVPPRDAMATAVRLGCGDTAAFDDYLASES